jgi:hypothetical protein
VDRWRRPADGPQVWAVEIDFVDVDDRSDFPLFVHPGDTAPAPPIGAEVLAWDHSGKTASGRITNITEIRNGVVLATIHLRLWTLRDGISGDDPHGNG